MISIKEIYNNEKFRAMVKESWKISWPMTCIMFYEFLIGLCDVYIASKFGKSAQAAYGFSFQLYFIFIIIGIALSVGAVSVISRLFTSPEKKEFSTAVNTSIVIAAVSGFVFGVFGFLFSDNIVGMLNLPAEVKAYAVPFMRIYSLAFFFDFILMNTNGILRACDSIKKSLWIMTLVCVMNVALNFLLAFRTPLGLKGVALATAISLFTGAAISLYYARKLTIGFKFSMPVAKDILKISWPSGLLQAFWQLGALVLFLILNLLPFNSVGVMAAFTNGLKIESAIFLPVFAFSMSNAVIVGNLLGKRKGKDAFNAGIITAIMGVFGAGVMTIVVMFNARHIAGILSGDYLVVNECMKYIFIALISEPIMAWGVILGGGLNGAGDTMGVMVITSLCIWLVRIPLSYILGIYFGWGSTAVWWSMNISILIQAIFITRRYFKRRWVAQAENNIYA